MKGINSIFVIGIVSLLFLSGISAGMKISFDEHIEGHKRMYLNYTVLYPQNEIVVTVDEEGGPLMNVHVKLIGTDPWLGTVDEGVTSPEGNVTLIPPSAGEYEIEATKTNYMKETLDFKFDVFPEPEIPPMGPGPEIPEGGFENETEGEDVTPDTEENATISEEDVTPAEQPEETPREEPVPVSEPEEESETDYSWVLWLAIIVIIVGAGYWYFTKPKKR